MNSLRIGCLYSYGCRMSREKGVEHILLSCIKNQNRFSEEQIWEALKKLQSYSAYRIITILKNKSDIFDEEVIHCYWLGDARPKSREARNMNHNFATLEKLKFCKSALSISRARSLVNCSVSWGEVIKINSDKAVILESGLMIINKKIIFSKRKREVGLNIVEKKNIGVGEIVSVHIDEVREVIDGKQASVLSKRTSEALKALAF